MRRIREQRRQAGISRKKLEFQPVEGNISISKEKAPRTKKGKKLLEAMMVERNLIQDKSKTMEVVGADVEALYPSLSEIQVAEIIYKAIMETEVGFRGINYLEGAKYIVLNSTAKECRISPLKRILPIRRHDNGTRPGITGEDPIGPHPGDQNQWSFPPNVRLTTREKRMIIATVMKIAVLVLFRTHVYEFGGKFFLQRKGGPIGLRSTCCIARIVMLWWDEKLLSLIAKNNLTLEQKARYMDDIRLWLYAIRLGWRWVDGGLKFSGEWRDEERRAGMTGLQKTVEIIKNMMNSICDFLVLTMESGDDFPDGRLPTLDLNIWVGEDNVTRYIFFEKPMASSMVIQRRSAMPENIQLSPRKL
jgi:hypothetical protein